MKASVVLCVVLLFSVCAHAQPKDTAFIAASTSYLKQLYTTSTKAELPIYTGGSYAEYVPLNGEFPYYLSDDWINGSIVYLGDVYPDIPLQFDLSTETIIIEHVTSARKLKLANERVSEFTLGDRLFVNLNLSEYPSLPESGFYEVLEDGDVKLYARRRKNLQKQIVSGKLIASFENSDRYYLYKDQQFHAIKSKSGLLKLLRDKPVLKQEMKRNKLVASDRESMWVAITALYNNLLP